MRKNKFFTSVLILVLTVNIPVSVLPIFNETLFGAGSGLIPDKLINRLVRDQSRTCEIGSHEI